MARNRVIYQSEALYVSNTAADTAKAKHEQLHRVQSANYSFNIARTDINQYGQAGALDTIVLEAPTVSADVTYLLADGLNEQSLGLTNSAGLTVGFLSNLLNDGSGKNLYIITSNDGDDSVANNVRVAADGGVSAIGIGNAYLTDYSLDVSVGSIPTVSVSFEALNINATTGVSGGSAGITGHQMSPAIKREDGTKFSTSNIVLDPASTGAFNTTALRPGDITLNFGTAETEASQGPLVSIAGTASEESSHIQSASLSFSIPRTPIERLGTRYAFARPADFPINASFDVSAIVNEITLANLTDIIDDEDGNDIELFLNQPGTATPAAIYKLKNAKLTSEAFSSSIGSNKTVDLSFQVSIGGSGDGNNNVYFSGANSTTPFA
jgi:hypothetical protein